MSDLIYADKPEEYIDSLGKFKIKYPIYLAEDGVELPNRGDFYVICRDGVKIHKETVVGSAFFSVKSIPFLNDPIFQSKFLLPKIPGLIIGQSLSFFRKIWQIHQSESYVGLFFNQKNQQYKLWCPNQIVTGASVQYDKLDKPDLETIGHAVGTIHSHCDFEAFHSSKDVQDENTFDGIHITLGNVDNDLFSIESSIAISGLRKPLNPDCWCDSLIYNYSNNYNLFLNEEETQKLLEFSSVIDQDWIPKVKTTVTKWWN